MRFHVKNRENRHYGRDATAADARRCGRSSTDWTTVHPAQLDPVGFLVDASAADEGGLASRPYVLRAAPAAPLLRLVELALGRRDVAELQIGLAEVFARQRVVGVEPQRFLVVAESDGETPGLAMGIAEIIEDAGLLLVGDVAEHLDRLS